MVLTSPFLSHNQQHQSINSTLRINSEKAVKHWRQSCGGPGIIIPTFWQCVGPNVHRPPLFSATLLYMACNP